MLKNLKIAQKLIATSIISALLLIIIGTMGIYNMNTINNNGKSLYEHSMSGLSCLYAIQSNFYKEKIDLEHILNVNFKNERANMVVDITAIEKDSNNNLAKYEKLPYASTKIKKLYTKIKSNLIQYTQAKHKVIDLGQSGDYEAATAQYIGEYKKLRKVVKDDLETLVKLNIDIAKSKAESNDQVFMSSLYISIAISVIGLILSLLSSIAMSRWITKRINNVVQFANNLKNGDLTQQLRVFAKDEIGYMVTCLNEAATNMKAVITEIVEGNEELTSSSEELTATMEEVSATMITIKESTKEISEGNIELNTSTEKISNASTKIDELTSELYNKAKNGDSASKEIMERANNIRNKAEQSSITINQLYDEKEMNIKKAFEDLKVLDEINNMAQAIGSIAEQTNLLSLNASIEAARAGEAGKGFNIVADEIRKLADQSGTTVANITRIVESVNMAIGNLVNNINDILTFINSQVKSDYEMFTFAGNQYQEDAGFVSQMSKEIFDSASIISNSVTEVNESMNVMSTTTERTVSNSEEILESISQTAAAVEEVSLQAQNTSRLAEKLTELSSGFSI